MNKAARIWKSIPPLHSLKTIPEHPPRTADPTLTTVALISRNQLIQHALTKQPCVSEYKFNMFTSVHGHNFAFHDIIILDNGLTPFTVENYMTRTHAKAESILQAKEKAPESDTDESATRETKEKPSYPQSRSFPDFAKLYDELDFPAYAEVTERLITRANEELSKWKNHLLNEGGFSAIRVKDPTTDEFLAKRCVLLPSTALTEWKSQFNTIIKQWLDFSLEQFPSRQFLMKFQRDEEEMKKLFYVKAVGVQNPDRKKFVDVPLWMMEVMLKKWRTDRALEEWSAKYQRQD